MTQSNIEAIRAVYDGWRNGDFRAGLHLYDPHAVLVQGPGFPESGAYLGLEGIDGYMRTFLEAWERVTIDAEELEPVGESVIAAVVQRGVGKGSGAAAELRYFQVWSFRGERVIRLETFRERAETVSATQRP